MFKRLTLALVAILVCGPAAVTSQSLRFQITDLGLSGYNIDNTDAPALAINNLGQVVGQTQTGPGTFSAFIYADGTLQLFGPPENGFGPLWNVAEDINDNGYIVGGHHVYRFDHGVVRYIGSVGETNYAVAINTRWQAAGMNNNNGAGPVHAVSWSVDGMQDLGTLGGSVSFAYGINDSSQIVGASTLGGDTALHAVVVSDSIMRDLGTLGGRHSRAFGVNNKGQIVGLSNLPGEISYGSDHAFLYTEAGGMEDLGTLGGAYSLADAISDKGYIVGMADTLEGSRSHAFIYAAGTMFDLNAFIDPGSDWELFRAIDINEHLQIVCFAYNRLDGLSHNVLLTPMW